MDDRSTDNSKEIIEQYRNSDKVSNIIYNSENSGNPFQQWDKGIQVARGVYIWIAESDDWCEPTLLETLLKGFESNNNTVLAYCQSYCVGEGGNIQFQSNHTSLAEYVNGKKFISKYILPRNPIFNAGMAVWKKQAYTQISYDYKNYKLFGDYLFWIELSNCGDVFISGKVLNYFRWHDQNTSTNAAKNGLSFTEQIPVLKKLLDRGIIQQKEYKRVLKKTYSLFKLQQKNLPKENVVIINKLFNSLTSAKLSLQLYFFQQYLKLQFKKFAGLK